MARYDVYLDDLGHYVVDVQADTLEGLNTRLVIPLMQPAVAPQPARRLNPLFLIKDEPHHLVTQYLAAIRRTTLTTTGISLRGDADKIAAALDMLIYGF